MIGVQLCPVDSWFFRDSIPFTAGSAPQEDVGSLFPPHPPTVVGALRVALARSRGWNGRDRWTREICAVLGNGPDQGALSFSGPFLLDGGRPLFRAPRHLLGIDRSGRWKPSALLRPGSPVVSDLGKDARLPQLPNVGDDTHKLKAGGHHWLTTAGMNAVLRGRPPSSDEVKLSIDLWRPEPRIGLERDASSRTAKKGMLYSTRHVRLRSGVSLGARIAGMPPDWPRPSGQLIPFGGEGRLADYQSWTPELGLESPTDEIMGTRRVTLVALTPIDVPREVANGTEPVTDLGGIRIVCACLDRPQRIGGWDSLDRGPLPVRSVLPPGSVLFCEIPDADRFATAVAKDEGLACFGSRTDWGFGLVALGVWPDAAA